MSKLISIPNEMALEFDIIKTKVYKDRGLNLSYSDVIQRRYSILRKRYIALKKKYNKLLEETK